MERASGIVCHITSLPSPYGIGSFGNMCYYFADLLKKSQCRYWQVLPFNPVDSVNSPYRSDSAFAGNPMLIDIEDLRDRGLITNQELDTCLVEDGWRVDFGRVNEDRARIYRLAFERIDDTLKENIKEFAKKNVWLQDYALYKALEAKFKEPWYKWPIEYKDRDKEALQEASVLLENDILYHEFLQYIFYDQWTKIKKDINKRGVEIIGDIPIYVSLESVDVWANKDVFQMKDDVPTRVAGVPPDFFSADGQLWGNPLYDWKAMRKNHYHWWISRILHCLELYDVLRIDHFRAFATYYAIPAGSTTAKVGEWEEGPGMHFFDVLKKHVKNPPIIAEDLGGDTDPDVQKLLKQTGFPGMRVVEMAFISMGESVHLPYNYVNNSVCYLGTHDNNTLLGWLKEDLSEGERNYALQYFDFDKPEDNWEAGGPNSEVAHAFIRGLFETGGGLTIIQLQDALGLGADCRMNTPATSSGNWEFKVPYYYLEQLNTGWLKFFNMTYQRLMNTPSDSEEEE